MKKIILSGCISAITLVAIAQNVGVGNSTPLSKLDLSGDLALRETGTPISTITSNTITLPAAKNSVYRVTAASPVITTINPTSGSINDGMVLTLIFAGTGTMTITNSVNNIQTNTGANLVSNSTTPVAAVSMIYNAALTKWVVTAAQGFNESAAGTSVSNTISGNTISTTVNGTTGTTVTVPNIYTADGTIASATRTVTVNGNTLNIGTDANSNTVNLGSASGSSTTSVNSGTGGVTVNTSSATTQAVTVNTNFVTTSTGIGVSANALTSGNGASISSTSTAGTASGSSYLLKLSRSGANANTAHTAYGISSAVTNTNATSGTNIAGYFSASGATTANYGIIVPNGGGNVGIGTATPGAALEISRGTNATQLTGTSADVVIQARNAATGDARLAFVSNDNTSNSGAGIIDGWANAQGGVASKAISIGFPSSQNSSVTNGVYGNIAFSVNNGTASTLSEAMRIQYNGSVGVGTTSPNGLLEVKKTTQLQSNLILSGQEYYNSGNTGTGIALVIGVDRTSNKQLWIMDQDNVATQNTTNPVLRLSANGVPSIDAIATNGTTILNLALCPGGGKVGIGTSTPARTLEVNNALKLSNSSSDANDGVIGTATFAPGLDIVGINTDATYRKISIWGGITQQQNDLGNTFLNTSYFNGYVGIGNGGPGYPLEINSSTGWTGYNRWYNNTYLLSWSGWSSSSTNLGIYCHPSIATDNYFVSVSDRRTKKEMTISRSADDLALINKIEITDYKFIDTLGKGTRPFKKVIAQQVEEIYPQAVSTIKGIIPNIYAPAKEVRKDGKQITLVMDRAHGLKEGDRVSIYDGAWNQQTKEICYADNMTFTVEIDNAKDEYFVYGKEIEDLKSVDYDAISMLNVSATQELYKQLEAEKAKNKALEEKMTTLEQQTKSDVDRLKASVETLQQILGAKAQR